MCYTIQCSNANAVCSSNLQIPYRYLRRDYHAIGLKYVTEEWLKGQYKYYFILFALKNTLIVTKCALTKALKNKHALICHISCLNLQGASN